MVTKALLVRLRTRDGAEVEEFLRSAEPLVRDEPGTVAWFGVRFGRSEYGIFDVFPDEAARQAHLEGQVAASLRERADELFAEPPEISQLDVIAQKLPVNPSVEVRKGLLLRWEPRGGHEQDVADFLRSARSIVEEEPATIAWFAIRADDGAFGIFDVFPDNRGRFAHLVGHVPREILKHAPSLVGSVPDMDMLDVAAAKLPA